MSVQAGARPATSALTLREFFDGVRTGRLVVQRCEACGELAVPPKAICPECHATAWEHAPLQGDGEVVSFTVIRVPPRALAAEAPYVIAVVRMGEGVSLLGRLVDVAIDAVRVGLPVRFVSRGDATADPPVITFSPGGSAARPALGPR